MNINKYIIFYNSFKTFVAGVKYKISYETADTYVSQNIEVPKSQEYITYEIGDLYDKIDSRRSCLRVVLTNYTANPVMAIERAAANCYDSEAGVIGKIMNACYESGHYSVLEFADFTFHIEGVSRALLAQITRHRMASFAVRSQRYCSEDDFRYVAPKVIANNKANQIQEIYDIAIKQSRNTYNKLLGHGIPPEDARMVLPNACETVIECKMNLRELIHFCNLRLCKRAQEEIRELATTMKNLVLHCVDIPLYGKAMISRFLVPKCEVNMKYPFCTEKKCCGRHKRLSEIYEGYEKYVEGTLYN